MLQAWVEFNDDDQGGTVEKVTCWGGYGIIADFDAAAGPGPAIGTWMLTLDNHQTAAVYLPELPDARGHVELNGLGSPPFEA